jgi:hypothetical protein
MWWDIASKNIQDNQQSFIDRFAGYYNLPNDHDLSIERLDSIAAEMTPAQIHKAKILASMWTVGKEQNLHTEPLQLEFENIKFPVTVNFPSVPEANAIAAPPSLKQSMIYYFSFTDQSTSLSYMVTILNMDKSLGVISKVAAQKMVEQSIATQVTQLDSQLGIKANITESDEDSFSGFPSKYLILERLTTPKLFGHYRSVFVGQNLITVWASGLDSVNNRAHAESFVSSIRTIP